MREVGCVGHWLPGQLQRHPLLCVLQQQAALTLGKALQDLTVVEVSGPAVGESIRSLQAASCTVGFIPSLLLPLAHLPGFRPLLTSIQTPKA